MKLNRILVFKCFVRHIRIPVKTLIIIQVIAAISTLVSLGQPYLYSMLVDEVMINKRIDLLWFIVLSMVILFLLGGGLAALSTFLSVRFRNIINLETKSKLIQKLMKKCIMDVTNLDVGKEQKLLEEDSGIVAAFFQDHVGGFLSALLYTVVYFGLMFFISPWLSIAIILFIPIMILFGYFIGKKYNNYQEEIWGINSANVSFLFNAIQKWREIKIQKLESFFSKEYEERLKPERRKLLTWMLYYALNGLFYEFKSGFVNNVLMYFLGGILIITGQLTIGMLLLFMSYLTSFSKNLDLVIQLLTDFSGNKAVYERIIKALNFSGENKKDLQRKNADIKIESLTFSYGKELPNVLTNISFDFVFAK